MRYGPGTDAWLSPPERKSRPAMRFSINIERDEPLCGEAASDNTHEYEVEVEFDDGCVASARITDRFDSHNHAIAVKPPVEVELTDRERESAEVDYSDELIAREEAAREDAADARADR